MKKFVEKVLIAAIADRTASVQITDPTTTATYIAAGEILVLDKNKKLITSATIADTDTIYIVEGKSATFSYTNEAGTTVTGARMLLYSDPIQANAVTEYKGIVYDSPNEATFTISGTFAPVLGDVYSIRIVYKDMTDKPGQTSKTYSTIATVATDPDTTYTALAALINADVTARVTASYASSTNILTITAKAIDDNEYLTSIDEYRQVNPEVFLYSDNFDSAVVTKTVNPKSGSGTWKLVRDEEKWSQGYEGQTNRTVFPVIGPDFRTIKNQTYNTILIRHKNWYTSTDGRPEQVDITTKIFIPTVSNQASAILGVINPWMESIGKGFNSISF